AQHLDALHGMALRVGMALPVEVVDQARESPALLVLAVVTRVGAHRRFDGVAVLAEVGVLDPLVEQGDGLLAGRKGFHRHRDAYLFSKYFLFFSMNGSHFSGTPLSGKIACTGQAASQAWQSMHSSGWM